MKIHSKSSSVRIESSPISTKVICPMREGKHDLVRLIRNLSSNARFSNDSHPVNLASSVELSVSGTTLTDIPTALNGNYFITVRYRNSLENTLENPGSILRSINLLFLRLPVDVYGGNLRPTHRGRYVICFGDMTIVDKEAGTFFLR